MKIVADENIPLLNEFFQDLGELTCLAGRNMTKADVQEADVLLVRSVTKVNEALLQGSSVRFVGTCTIGTDHLDSRYLQQAGITFASAPGCNAQSVVDYVLSALSTYSEYKNLDLLNLIVGIVGVGNVGFKLRQRLETMGIQVLAVDPFKSAEQVGALVSLDEALKADVLCLHTPLTFSGEEPTYHLIQAKELQQMRPDACILNAGRGPVIHNQDLLNHLKQTPSFTAILDVWEDEPEPNLALLDQCLLATPHIAGYSLDGKMNGTAMIYQALCRFLGKKADKALENFMPEPAVKELVFSAAMPKEQLLRTAIRAVYDVRGDDLRMRNSLEK
ncbi:MAG: 4-phosphoerythronate dehydrogenase, partial [Venatoribacter sp.]